MLNNTKPHLQAIKSKLGILNKYYLKISTEVIRNALNNVIDEVNEAQAVFATLGATHLESVLKEAWKTIEIMDGFDIESSYKKYYNKNRSILKGLCDQIDALTLYIPDRQSQPASATLRNIFEKDTVQNFV